MSARKPCDEVYPMQLLLNKVERTILGDSHIKEILTGSSWTLIFKILGLGVGFLLTITASRLFGAQGWGVFSLSLSVITFAAILSRLGLDTALIKLVAEHNAREKGLSGFLGVMLKILAVVGPNTVLISILVYLFSYHIADYIFQKPYLTRVFQNASLAILPMSLTSIFTQSLRGIRKIKEYTFIDLVGRYLFTLIILPGIWIFYRGNSAVMTAYIISMYICTFLSMFLLIKYARFSPAAPQASISYSFIFSLAIPLLMANSIQFIKSSVDTLMLGVYMTEDYVGVYNVAFPLASLVVLPLFAADSISAPKFAEFYSTGDSAALKRTFQQTSKLIFLTSLPILIVILLMPGLLLGMVGPDFEAGALALSILALGQFVNAISGPVGYYLLMTGDQLFFQNITLFYAFLGIFLNMLLIPNLGLTGAAISTFIGIVAWNLSCVIRVKKKWGFWTIFNPLTGNLF
jgi:O-antigen/teichoic acid export membrane protein